MAPSTGSRTRSGRCSGRTTPSSRATAACTVRDRPATPRAVSSSRPGTGARSTPGTLHRLAILPRYAPVDPQQSFPDLEQAILERWRERDVFGESVRRREGAEPYVFYEGPPTANGRPGSHHVLSRVFKDVFPRYRTMRGRLVHRKGGWDTHGLPVELEIEKQLGFKTKDDIEAYGVAEFNAKCRESVLKYIDEWHQLTERIGFWIDTDDAYYTMDDDYIESVWWSLKQVWDKGLLYEGYKVVPYCPRCGTALSSHEVSLGYKDVVDTVGVRAFPGRGEPGVSFVGWTTTPWTLLSNAALAVGPDIAVRARHPGRRAADRGPGPGREGVRRGRADLRPGARLRARGHGLRAAVLLRHRLRREGPHRAAGRLRDHRGRHRRGPHRARLRRGRLPPRRGAGPDAAEPGPPRRHLRRPHGPYAGRKVKETDADIVEELRANGKLLRAEDYEHSYPHCWRCDTALLYYAKSSWYVATTKVKDQLLASNEAVTWYPEHIMPALTEALKDFQTALGVEPTGTVDAATLAALEKAIAEAQAEPSASPTSEPSTEAPSDTETPSPSEAATG